MKALLKVGILLLVALILMSAAFINHFPLISSDTGQYIASGMWGYVPNDRPIIYGLFIRFCSFFNSLWMVIFCQSFILGYILFEVIHLFSYRIPGLYVLLIVSITVVLSSISWFSSQLMADIFTPIGSLALLILLFKENKLWQNVSLAAIIWLAEMAHASNLMIFCLVVLLIGLYSLRWSKSGIVIPFSRWIYCVILVSLPWIILPFIQYCISGKFVINESSFAFLIAKMDETGVLAKYLDQECPTQNYTLCNYKDSLPHDATDFLWNPKSPLNQDGGWEAHRAEYTSIVNSIATNPAFLIKNMQASFIGTLQQLSHNKIGAGIDVYGEGTPPYGSIKEFFPSEITAYSNSLQNHYRLNFNLVNYFQYSALILSLLFILFYLIKKSADPDSTRNKILTTSVLLIIASNAVVSGTFANINDRFAGRVSWLLIFSALILLISEYIIKKKGVPS